MALSDPRSFYGIHSVAFYDRDSREYHGVLKVLGSSSLSLAGELVPLNGGSSKYPWHVEDGLITSELSLVFRSYEDFLFELFLGKAPTSNAAEAGGSSTALTNATGTTCFSATIGVATATVESGEEADVKFASYLIKVVSSTTVDVYASSDVDFARGDDVTYQDDLLKITASALTIATSTAVSVPNTGIELTGGSGTIAMTVGDTCVYSTRPINTESTDVVIGAASDTFPEFGAIVVGKKRGNGEMVEIDLFRCKAVGMPIGFEENAWSEASVTAQAFNDSARGGVFKMRHVK